MENRNTSTIPKLLLSLSLAFASFTPLFAPPQNQPAMPELTPQQMAELEQELAKINEEMQSYIKTLPPEKQQEIAEIEQAINQMSDEELEQLFEQIFTDENFLKELEQMYPEEAAQPESSPEPAYEPAKPSEKPIEKPKVAVNRVEQAAKMIQSLTEITDTFLSKLDVVPEIDDLVRNWIKKQQVRGWRANIAWHDIKAQIDLFNHKLKKLLTKEPGTNEYRFLPDLVQNESLYNNLAHMENVLKMNVPKIEIAIFGLKKLNPESKTAMKSVLNKYAEGLSDLQLIPTINTVIEKHEPIAKQMREKEDALAKKALEESKVPRYEKPMVIAGKPETHRTSGSANRYPDYSSSYYPSYQPSYTPSYAPVSTPAAPVGGHPAAPSVPGGKGTAKPSAPAKPEDKKEGEDTESQKGKKEEGKKKEADKAKGKGKETPGSKKFEVVEKKFKEASMVLSDPLLLDIRANLFKPGQAQDEVPGLVKKAIEKINASTTAVNDLGKELADLSEKIQKEYKGKVKVLYGKTFEHTLESQLKIIKNNWKRFRNSVNEDRARAYGINFDEPQSNQNLATSMDAQEPEVFAGAHAQAQAGLENPEEILEAARRMQAGLPEAEQAEGVRAPAPVTSSKAQPAAPQMSAAQPAPVAPVAERKEKREPQTLDAALNALKAAIDGLAK